MQGRRASWTQVGNTNRFQLLFVETGIGDRGETWNIDRKAIVELCEEQSYAKCNDAFCLGTLRGL